MTSSITWVVITSFVKQAVLSISKCLITINSPADVEGRDTHGVAGSDEAAVACVKQDEGEDTVQHVNEALSVLLVLQTGKSEEVDQ